MFETLVIEAKSKKASSSAGNEESDDDDDTPTSRFVSRLLKWLVQGFIAKNKVVRFRCIHIVSEMISHLGEIEQVHLSDIFRRCGKTDVFLCSEDAYNDLRDALIDRLNDKETLIRTHATIALSKLVGSEDPDEAGEGEQTIVQTLLDTISTDPAAYVPSSGSPESPH